MKKSILVLLLLVAALCLTACELDITPTSQPTFSDSTNPTASQSTQPSQPESQPTQPTQPLLPVLQTEIAQPDASARFETLHTWGALSEGQSLIWCNLPISEVALVPIAEAETVCYPSEKALYTLDVLETGDAILLSILVPEGQSAHAICFTAGQTAYAYAIAYNGRDGGISLVEITICNDAPEITFSAQLYALGEDETGMPALFPQTQQVESNSPWHVWAALKHLNPLIPGNAYLNRFEHKDGIGHLDLTDAIYAANVGASYEGYLLSAIANTFMETYGLQTLSLTVDGETYESGHITLDEPFTRLF